jgi:hypothetical protein
LYFPLSCLEPLSLPSLLLQNGRSLLINLPQAAIQIILSHYTPTTFSKFGTLFFHKKRRQLVPLVRQETSSTLPKRQLSSNDCEGFGGLGEFTQN